jgi:hypothetical protein
MQRHGLEEVGACLLRRNKTGEVIAKKIYS